MKEILKKYALELGDFQDKAIVRNPIVSDFLSRVCLVLAVGGKGERLHALTQGLVNKNSLMIGSNGESMVERVIGMYARAGVKKCVALVCDRADSIVERLGDGSKWGVEISYSTDPGDQPSGRGGALLHAVISKYIDRQDTLIIHNPDDQIVEYDDFIIDLIASHISSNENGCIGTVAVAKTTPYPYTGFHVQQGRVIAIERIPEVPIPAHIGVTIFSPEIFPYFDEHIPVGKKVDFEEIIFPILTQCGLLNAFGVDKKYWIPVNDLKGYKELLGRLGYEFEK